MITASENSQNSLRSIGRSARFQKIARNDLDVMSMYQIYFKAVRRTDLPNDHPSQTESGRSIQM